ncbi:hypothetical protein BC938DRAFT_480460, partial [Jimgerdemannia flammicorona]
MEQNDNRNTPVKLKLSRPILFKFKEVPSLFKPILKPHVNSVETPPIQRVKPGPEGILQVNDVNTNPFQDVSQGLGVGDITNSKELASVQAAKHEHDTRLLIVEPVPGVSFPTNTMEKAPSWEVTPDTNMVLDLTQFTKIRIGDKDIPLLLEALKNTLLPELDLRWNKISGDGARALAESLMQIISLRALNLD